MDLAPKAAAAIAGEEMGYEGVDWILVAQDRDQWRALVNTVMNSHVI
jgi:hypothetical protein